MDDINLALQADLNTEQNQNVIQPSPNRKLLAPLITS